MDYSPRFNDSTLIVLMIHKQCQYQLFKECKKLCNHCEAAPSTVVHPNKADHRDEVCKVDYLELFTLKSNAVLSGVFRVDNLMKLIAANFHLLNADFNFIPLVSYLNKKNWWLEEDCSEVRAMLNAAIQNEHAIQPEMMNVVSTIEFNQP